MVALICWSTGELPSSTPRALDQGLRQAAWFWVLLGGALAIYPLVAVVSYPLTVVVLWVQCSLLAPMAVAMNVWYPKRPLPASAHGRTRWLLLGANRSWPLPNGKPGSSAGICYDGGRHSRYARGCTDG